MFNESSEFGLNNQLDQFFNSFQQLSFNPDGMTERTDVVSQGRTLSQMIGKTYTDITNLRGDMEAKVKSGVTEINRITTEVARLAEPASPTDFVADR